MEKIPRGVATPGPPHLHICKCFTYVETSLTFNSCAKIYTVFLLALQSPRFKAAEYTVLREEEWRRLKDEGYPEHLIKKKDAKKTWEIDAALKRTVLPHNTAAFLQSQCQWVCHQMELRIVLVGKVMEEPLFNGYLLNTATTLRGLFLKSVFTVIKQAFSLCCKTSASRSSFMLSSII